MLIQYSEVSVLLNSYSVVLPLFIGVLKLNREQPNYYYVLLLLLIFIGAFDVLVVNVYAANGHNNMFLFHLYTAVEFSLLALFYRSVVKSADVKKAIAFLVIAFLTFKVLDVSFITDLKKIDTLAMTIESVIMISLSMFYFGQLITIKNSPLVSEPLFWINSAILLYFSSSFFLFLFSSFISDNSDQYYAYWTIHNIVATVKNVLFAVAMIVLSKSINNHQSVIHDYK